jgi:methylated-DNA-[protein]-cysteine S-methyltransferase
VGQALRKNPFAPYVPCHRVITSSNFIGGFYGERGNAKNMGTLCQKKIKMLAQEGVEFSSEGYLKDLSCLWKR